jgi:3-hydroxybutyryl-CoA dehydrogenase
VSVGVVGAGTMGTGIALVSIRAGFDTFMCDTRHEALNRSCTAIRDLLDKSAARGQLTETPEAVMGRLSTSSSLVDLGSASLVIEAINEDLADKHELISALDRHCSPDTLIASNTSTLSITEIASASSHPERIVGMHFCVPAHRMALVEIAAGLNTGEACFNRAWQVCEAMGQTPVRVPDTPGFIVNRFAIPYHNDAVRMLEMGVAEAQDIDLAIRTALGYPMGPLELLDLVGLDTQIRVSEGLRCRLADARATPPDLLKQMVAAGRLGKKTGRGFYTYEPTSSKKV